GMPIAGSATDCWPGIRRTCARGARNTGASFDAGATSGAHAGACVVREGRLGDRPSLTSVRRQDDEYGSAGLDVHAGEQDVLHRRPWADPGVGGGGGAVAADVAAAVEAVGRAGIARLRVPASAPVA